MDWYRPGAVVLQCGADSLAGDKLGVFNLSMKGHADCVKFVRSFGLPMIVLGGGGYAVRNVSRTWTYETGLLVGQQLEEDLPFNDYLDYYGPKYKLEVPETNMDNHNTPEYLNDIQSKVFENLRNLPFAPSVQNKQMPLDPYNLNYSDDSDEELDEKISKAANNFMDDNGDYVDDDDYSMYRSRTSRVNGRNRSNHYIRRNQRRFFQSSFDDNDKNYDNDHNHRHSFGCGHNHNSNKKPKLDDILKLIIGKSSVTQSQFNRINNASDFSTLPSNSINNMNN